MLYPLTVKGRLAGGWRCPAGHRAGRDAARDPGQPAVDRAGERAALPGAGHAVPAVHVARRRGRPARRPRPGGARRRGGRGDRALRRPAGLHHVLRGGRAGARSSRCSTATTASPCRASSTTAARSCSSSATRCWRCSTRPARQPDHALRAVRAALADAGRRSSEIAAGRARTGRGFRVGANTGPALVGNIGSETLRGFNAMGDAVNVAARLQTLAEPGQVVIGEATLLAAAATRVTADAAGRPGGQGPAAARAAHTS